MLEIEHHCNLTEITGRPGLSWSVCKPLYINHIKDTADEQISNAGRKLAALEKVLKCPWGQREAWMSLQKFVGHASTIVSMLVPFPASHHPAVFHHHHIPHHQMLTPTPKAGCRYIQSGYIGPIWKHHHFLCFSNPFFQFPPTWRWWHCAGGSSHAEGLAGSDHTLVPQHRGVGSWKSRGRRFLHPAELEQHPPLMNEVDTSSALPDHNRSLAPGSVHF